MKIRSREKLLKIQVFPQIHSVARDALNLNAVSMDSVISKKITFKKAKIESQVQENFFQENLNFRIEFCVKAKKVTTLCPAQADNKWN